MAVRMPRMAPKGVSRRPAARRRGRQRRARGRRGKPRALPAPADGHARARPRGGRARPARTAAHGDDRADRPTGYPAVRILDLTKLAHVSPPDPLQPLRRQGSSCCSSAYEDIAGRTTQRDRRGLRAEATRPRERLQLRDTRVRRARRRRAGGDVAARARRVRRRRRALERRATHARRARADHPRRAATAASRERPPTSRRSR